MYYKITDRTNTLLGKIVANNKDHAFTFAAALYPTFDHVTRISHDEFILK